jgi:cellulose synthase/poly-beta-1,6-N-acetylglucosamine synthase-like glycosyltransferase
MIQNEESRLLPSVAAVIIGRNEGDRLRVCLSSVRAMNYPRKLVEVIYVDSSSTDSSVEFARSQGVKTIVLDGPTTAARGRNAGWTQTEAPFVLFLDGDTILHPDFVANAIAHFADPQHTGPLAGVYGNRRETCTADSIYNAIFDLDWNAGTGYSLFFGGDALVRREALAAVGGYNPLLIAGEEPDLCRRMRGLGYRILHVDEPMTLHDLAMFKLSQYWRRSVRTGYAYAEISTKYAKTDDPLWSAESRSNIIRGIFWWWGPILSIVISLLFHSIAPFALVLVAAFILFARTAAKAVGKTHSLKLLIAYGLHSHLQQVPILFGQIRYHKQRRRGGNAAIIEYKATP